MSLTREMIAFAMDTDYRGLPVSVRHAASRCVLDHLGCVIGGVRTDLGRIVAGQVMQEGGEPQATLVASGGKRVPAVAAALANGTAANALDFDDTLVGHPGSTVIAAALATAEYGHRDGPDLLAAVTIGYEVCSRIASFWQPIGGRYRHVFDTATLETFGAVAAAGRLLDLSLAEFENAFGIAAATAPIPRVRKAEGEGGVLRPMLKSTWGWASAAGVRAALLAKAGLTGQAHSLDGENLIWRLQPAVPGIDLKSPEDRLGEFYFIERTEFKPYPACRFLHSTLEALSRLIELEAIGWDEIAKVEVHSFDLLGDPYHYILKPSSHSEAQFSTPFCAAALLYHGRLTADAFTPEGLAHKEVLALAQKVTVGVDPEYQQAYPQQLGSRVRVSNSRGEEWQMDCNHPRGGPSNPLDDAELNHKFVDLAGRHFSPSESRGLAKRILNIEQESNIRDFMGALG